MSTNICPACLNRWHEDIEEDTGKPYTCSTCYNGTITQFEEDNDYNKKRLKKSALKRKRSTDSAHEW
jgi:hypothetical protein